MFKVLMGIFIAFLSLLIAYTVVVMPIPMSAKICAAVIHAFLVLRYFLYLRKEKSQ